MPLELPAVTVPPARNAGRSLASASGVESGRGMLVDLHVADGDQLVGEAPGGLRRGPALLRAQREGVLILARHVVALGHVLARLAHALEREHRLHRRVREAPAERAVVEHAVAAREGALGLGRHERRAAHRLDAAGHEEVAVARDARRGRPRRSPRAPRRRAG